MNENVPVIVFVVLVGLAIAAVLMPLYVIAIHTQSRKIAKTLAAMEDLMRNGR